MSVSWVPLWSSLVDFSFVIVLLLSPGLCLLYSKMRFLPCLHIWYLDYWGIAFSANIVQRLLRLLLYDSTNIDFCFSLFMAEPQSHNKIRFSCLYDSLNGRRIPKDCWCEVPNILKPTTSIATPCLNKFVVSFCSRIRTSNLLLEF